MNALEKIKFRHEYKYLISEQDRIILERRIKILMKVDSHAADNNNYLVRSIYFDDYSNSCYCDIEDGVDNRVKYRVRAYNCNSDVISLETKHKMHDRNYKKRCFITGEEYRKLFLGSLTVNRCNDIWRKPMLQRGMNVIKPVVMVEYLRTSYVCEAGNVRITMDSNICSSEVDACGLVLFDEGVGKRVILPQGKSLMEVKFDNFIPDYIYQALSVGNLQRTSFSKYYLSRKFSLQGGML